MKTQQNENSTAAAALTTTTAGYLTPSQLAQALGVSRRTLTNWERSRILQPAFHVGHVVRYELGPVLASLQSQSGPLKVTVAKKAAPASGAPATQARAA
jgi:transcriptional regulator with XRE-family HTH domain